MTAAPQRSRGVVPIASAGSRTATGAVVHPIPFEGDDAALVVALRAGHPGAAARLYEESIHRVQGLIFRVLGVDPEFDDVVQDAFVGVFGSIRSLRDPGALRGWVLSVAVRSARRHLQRRARKRWLRFYGSLGDVSAKEPAATPSFENREALRELYALLDRFPVDERIALVLHRVEGLSLGEAAEASRMSIATFKRRLARAESRLEKGAAERPALSDFLGGAGP